MRDDGSGCVGLFAIYMFPEADEPRLCLVGQGLVPLLASDGTTIVPVLTRYRMLTAGEVWGQGPSDMVDYPLSLQPARAVNNLKQLQERPFSSFRFILMFVLVSFGVVVILFSMYLGNKHRMEFCTQ